MSASTMGEIRDVMDGSTWQVSAEEGRQFSGGFGTVSPVRISGLQGRYAMKVLRDVNAVEDPRALRQVALVAHLRHDEATANALPGRPLSVVQSLDGRIGVVSRWIDGEVMTPAWVQEHALSASLRRVLPGACMLADQVRALHALHLVIGDMRDENWLGSCSHKLVASVLIDVDNCGYVDGDGNAAPGLPYLAAGFDDGESLLAPEFGQARRASRAADAWSMAVRLHRFLFGVDPFSAEYSQGDVREARVRWPQTIQHAGWAKFVAARRALLGSGIDYVFRATFTPRGARWEPTARPTAADFSRALRGAADWLVACPSCGIEYVSRGRQVCPACRKSTSCLALRVGESGTVMQAPRTIRSSELGFRDGDAYDALSFTMRSGQFVVEPAYETRILSREFGPGHASHFPVMAGTAVRVLSRTGRQAVTLRFVRP